MANEALRAVALTEAGKLGLKSTADVIVAANAYLSFLTAEPKGAAQASAPGSDAPPPAKATGTAPAKATKPAKTAAPPAKKLVPEKSEEEKAAEALAKAAAEETPEGEPEFDWAGDDGQKEVGKIVSALIAANKRPEAIKLLADYKAASVSGVKPDDREQFVADGNSLLQSEPDITQ